MKKIKTLLLVSMLSITALGVVSCKKKVNDGIQEITFVEEYDIPSIKLGVEYDFEPYFTKQIGVEYTMTAMYLDDDLNEVPLDVDGFKFTQNEFADVFVTITATKGNETRSGEVQIPVDMRYDKTDHWVVDSLFSGTGMTKKLNYLPQYRTSLDSLTSVRFAYKGSAAKDSPISAIPFIDWPSNSRLTVGDWSNAVITFDVYNSSADNIVFGFIMKHSSGISYSFDQCEKFVCEPNQWTHISLNVNVSESTHYCEDIGNGWIRVYVNLNSFGASLDNVSRIYATLNAADGSGERNLHFDNLHFVTTPTHTITFKDYDGSVISSAEYPLGATVNVPNNPTRAADAGECSYVFAGWDYSVTEVQRNATYTATYTKTDIVDLWNGSVEKGDIDTITNDTADRSENSRYSLNIVEPIAGGNLPYFAITLDKTYDLTNSYMVFDFKNIDRNGWLVVFDFVNNGDKLGLWNMLTLNTGIKADTHTCEDLGNGWLRVYVDLDVLNSSLSSVSKIYATLNASDGSGTLDINFDNLHFEKKRVYTEADDAISACGLGAVNGGSATIDSSVVSSTSVKSAKFNVPAGNSGVWWNYDIDLTKVTGSALNMSGKTITFDVKIVGNMTWVGFKVADGNGNYVNCADTNDYAWMNLSSGWSGFGMSIAAIDDGWYRVSFNPDTSFSSAGSNIAKLRFLVNPQDGSEANMYVDNLYLDSVIDLPTEADDYSTSCGLVAVNGGTIAVDTNVVSAFSSSSIKANVPAGNSGVWWNYDLDLTGIHGSALNLSGKAITFDLKIVGSMSLVGFTVADSNGNYAQPDGEGYVWTNLTNGWGADKGWIVTAISDGWFRVSFTADTKFSGCSSDVAKLRFLVNPSTADEASLYIDNLYVENVLPIDYIGQCGLVAVNGGTIAKATSDVSKLSTESVKCTVPAGNNDAWWNYDVSLREIAGGALDLSGQTISFDLKIVGSMGWAGFAVSADGITYSDYAWTNLSDGWSGYGMVVKSIGNGWLRCTVTLDTNFSAYSNAIGVLRFMVHPTDNNESVMYIDNLFLG